MRSVKVADAQPAGWRHRQSAGCPTTETGARDGDAAIERARDAPRRRQTEVHLDCRSRQVPRLVWVVHQMIFSTEYRLCKVFSSTYNSNLTDVVLD